MILIPQIYLRDGKTVKREGTTSPLIQEDAFATAKAFKDAGAEGLLCVDLSVTPVKTSPNMTLIKRIHDELDLGVYVSGGFKTAQEIEVYIQTGVELIILGPIAYQKPDFLENVCKRFPGKIAAHIDVKAGRVIIPGYAVTANKTAIDYAESFLAKGVRYILYSDVNTEGLVKEENLVNLEKFCRETNARVICTSEISRLSDIETIVGMNAQRLEALVLEKPLYENQIDLRGAIAMLNDLMLSAGSDSTLTEM